MVTSCWCGAPLEPPAVYCSTSCRDAARPDEPPLDVEAMYGRIRALAEAGLARLPADVRRDLAALAPYQPGVHVVATVDPATVALVWCGRSIAATSWGWLRTGRHPDGWTPPAVADDDTDGLVT